MGKRVVKISTENKHNERFIMATRNLYRFFTIVTVIGIAMYMSGCSALNLGNNLAQDNTVKVERIDQNKGVYVNSVNVYEKNNKLAVYGSLKRKMGNQGHFREHVDINILGPDDEVLASKTVRTQPIHPHHNVRTVHFTAYLDIVPPPGSVVQVAAHKGIHL